MSQSPTLPASGSGPGASGTMDADSGSAPATPKRGALTPLQTAAATAVIFTSMVALAAMTGIFSTNTANDPSGADLAPVASRSAGGPLPLAPQPNAALRAGPPEMATEIDHLRSGAPAAAISTATPPVLPVMRAPITEAESPAKPRRAQRHALSHEALPHRGHTGKTREQVIAELMQAKRDGSYRAAQENYR